MAKRRRIRWDRVALVFSPVILLILVICVSCNHHSDGKTPDPGQESSQVSGSSVTTTTTTDAYLASSTITSTTVTDITDLPDVPVAAQPKDSLILVLDAGHGGDDGGATNATATRLEKDDNLRITLALQKAFEKYPQIQVIMTRDTDTFVSLKNRCNIANEAGADFFLSMHRNSASSGNGIEIWINNDSDGANATDRLVAEYIMELLDDVGISKNRGIKGGYRNSVTNRESDNYYVNRYTNMPSCLIEMGFMTSDTDNSYFDTRCDAYAEAIATAFMEFVTDKNLLRTTAE